MMLNISIDLGHGKEYSTQFIMDERAITNESELRITLHSNFKYMVEEVVEEVVKVLVPESTSDILTKVLLIMKK